MPEKMLHQEFRFFASMDVRKRLEERLREFPGEQLIEIVVSAAERNTDLRKQLLHLTAKPKDLIAAGKRTVGQISRIKAGRRQLSAKAVSEKIESAIHQLNDIGRHSPDQAFELLCNLLATEEHIHGEVDDSYGYITDVFRGELLKSAAVLVRRVTNHSVLEKNHSRRLRIRSIRYRPDVH